MFHAITLGLCLENLRPGSTRHVRSITKIAHAVPQGRPGLWGHTMQQLWPQGSGGCRWIMEVSGKVWSATWVLVLGFQSDGGVCTSREKKKPDQVLGHYIIYISMNWVTIEICAQSGQCSTIMFGEDGFLPLCPPAVSYFTCTMRLCT